MAEASVDAAEDAQSDAEVEADYGTQPTDEVLGTVEPLGEPLLFAFKAGYHDEEQVWLLGESGALRRISTWDIAPTWKGSCCCGWSTGGYFEGMGRFGPLVLDPSGRTLLFTEHIKCQGAWGRYPARLVAHDIETGITRVIADSTNTPSVIVTGGTVVVTIRHEPEQYSPVTLPPGAVEVFELNDGILEPIAIPTDTWIVRFGDWDNSHVVRWRDRRLLLVDGVPALEDDGDGWQLSHVFDELETVENFLPPTSSPSGDRLCMGANLPPLGWMGGSLGAVLQPDGTWLSTPEGEGRGTRCFWRPDESQVAFGPQHYAVEASGLTELGETVYATGSWGGYLYGSATAEAAIVRVDWDTLDAETVLSAEAIPEMCEWGRPIARLPPDERPIAIVKLWCGCDDCDISGSIAWHRDTGTVEVVEDVFGGHDVNDIAWLPDGGAAVLSTQHGRDSTGAEEIRPTPGSYFRVHANGSVEVVGPLDGVQGALHSPAAPLR